MSFSIFRFDFHSCDASAMDELNWLENSGKWRGFDKRATNQEIQAALHHLSELFVMTGNAATEIKWCMDEVAKTEKWLWDQGQKSPKLTISQT